jgi:hypothetical protein
MDTAEPRRRGRPRKIIENVNLEAAVADLQEMKAALRPALRSEMREEDPRAAADRRAKEILGHLNGDFDQAQDEFYINPTMIPPGWAYEWKRHSVYGKEESEYQVQLAQTGWTAVPASRHPALMPASWKGNTIDRKGQRLMERPQVISDRMRDADLQRARAQVRGQRDQLAMTPANTLSRDADPRVSPMIKKSYEASVIPESAP